MGQSKAVDGQRVAIFHVRWLNDLDPLHGERRIYCSEVSLLGHFAFLSNHRPKKSLDIGDDMIANRLSAVYLSITLAACFATLLVVTPAHAQQADAIYSESCAECHGDKGHGDGPAGKYLKPPPTDFGTSLKGKSDD